MVQRQRYFTTFIWIAGLVFGIWYMLRRRSVSDVEAGPTQAGPSVIPLPPKPPSKPVETREQRNPAMYPPPEVERALREASDIVGIPYDLLRAVCWVESKFIDRKNIGFAGEVGIMQVTPIAMRDVNMTISPASSLDDQALAGAKFLDKCARYAVVAKSQHEIPAGTNLTDWAIMYYNGGTKHGSAERTYLRKVREHYTGNFVGF